MPRSNCDFYEFQFSLLSSSSAQASFKIGSTKILNESKHINLSLHYLEMVRALNGVHGHFLPLPRCDDFVLSAIAARRHRRLVHKQCITALHDRAIHPERHTHVPYRNCMMTSVLKDSLGGNCKVRRHSGALSPFGRMLASYRRTQLSWHFACIMVGFFFSPPTDGHDRHHVW